jgi:hypothetical protein
MEPAGGWSQALCTGLTPLFYPTDPTSKRHAVAVCMTCPVREPSLADAQATEVGWRIYGVRAGSRQTSGMVAVAAPCDCFWHLTHTRHRRQVRLRQRLADISDLPVRSTNEVGSTRRFPGITSTNAAVRTPQTQLGTRAHGATGHGAGARPKSTSFISGGSVSATRLAVTSEHTV